MRAYHLEEDAYDVVDEDEPNRIISLAAARVLRLTAPVEDGELQKGDQVRAALLCAVCCLSVSPLLVAAICDNHSPGSAIWNLSPSPFCDL